MCQTNTLTYGAALAGLLLGLSACAGAPKECLAPQAAADHPADRSTTLEAADGTCLRSFAWDPAPKPAGGVVVIVHGIRDYALRYDDFAARLKAAGFAVYAQDLRGHAHSGGARQRFDSMAQMVADVDRLVADAAHRHPGLPVFLYGHSLGGLIASNYALAHGNKLKGLVLSAAALKLPLSVSPIQVSLARLIAGLAPGLPAQAIDDSEFSRDPAVMAKLASDTLIVHDRLPAASVAGAIGGIEAVQAAMESFTLPLLILHGTADKVNPIEGSRELAARARSADKTLKIYDGLYHDLLNEPERDQVASDVLDWIRARR